MQSMTDGFPCSRVDELTLAAVSSVSNAYSHCEHDLAGDDSFLKQVVVPGKSVIVPSTTAS